MEYHSRLMQIFLKATLPVCAWIPIKPESGSSLKANPRNLSGRRVGYNNVSELARTAVPVSFKTALNKTSKHMTALPGIWQTDGCNDHQSCHLSDLDICHCVVTGVAGFAFGLVAAAVWLHILTPVQPRH